MVSRRTFALVAVIALVVGVADLFAAEVHEGKVISVGQSSITVRDKRDGENDVIQVTAETKITRNGKPAKLSDVAVGDRAKVVVADAGGKLTAKSIEAFMPE